MLTGEDEVEIVALHRRGWSISAIARHSGRDRKTVRAWLAGERRRRPAAPSVLEPYRAYLAQRLTDDPHVDATVLLRELRGLGFERSYPTLTRELRRLGLRPVCEVCKRGGHALTVELTHEPGEELQLDWLKLGETPWGEPAHVLVGALSHSGRIRALFSEGESFAELAAALKGTLRRFGGTARCWRTDRMATVVEPGSGRLRAGGGRARQALRRHGGGLSAAAGAAQGCRRGGDPLPAALLVAQRRGGDAGTGAPSMPYPAELRVERVVSSSALVAFEGNRYSVPPAQAGQLVTVLARLGEPMLRLVSAAGVLVATHRRLPAGAGQTLRQPGHAAALEQAVLAAFTTRPPCRRKPNRPPSVEALALAAALAPQALVEVAVPSLERYAELAGAR